MRYIEISSSLVWLNSLLNDINKKYKTIFTDAQFKFGNIAKTWFDYFTLRSSLVRGKLRRDILREGGIYNNKVCGKVAQVVNDPNTLGLCVFSNYFYKNDTGSNLVQFAIQKDLDLITTAEVVIHEIAHFLHYRKFMSKKDYDSITPLAIKVKSNHSNHFKKFYIDLLNIQYKDMDLINHIKISHGIPINMGFTLDMLDQNGVIKNYDESFEMNGGV